MDKNNWREIGQHELSAQWPELGGEAFEAFVADVAVNGLRVPIVLHEGRVLDGWTRLRACKKLGIEPTFTEYSGNNPVGCIISLNAHRRHMSPANRALCMSRNQEWNPRGKLAEMAPGIHLPTIAEVAELAGVSGATVKRARAAVRAGLDDAVASGEISLKEATAIAKLPAEKRQAAVSSTKQKKAEKRLKLGPQPETAASKDATQSVPTPTVEQLRADIDTLREQVAELGAELEAATAAADPDALTRIRELQAQLRTVSSQRDDYMRQNDELKKQVRMLNRKLGAVA